VVAQAVDRLHRLGQTKEVHVYHLVAKGSIEPNLLNVSNTDLPTIPSHLAELLLHNTQTTRFKGPKPTWLPRR
jgi:hypothetical protein